MGLQHVFCRRLFLIVVLGAGSTVANYAEAATRLFDVNGATPGSGVTNGSTYSWEDANWTLDATGATATTNWVDADFPKFSAGTDATVAGYSVTVGADHVIDGMQLATAAAAAAGGTKLNINPSGGVLKVGSAAQGVFVVTNGTMIINAPLGQVDTTSQLLWQGGGGSLNLYGDNSALTNGVILNAANGLNFNSATSFGPAATPIKFLDATIATALGLGAPTVTTYVLANPDTTAPLTIPNSVTMRSDANTTIIYTGHDAVTFSGTWTLGTNIAIRTNRLQIGNTPFPSAKMIITNGIAGDDNSDLIVQSLVNGTLVVPGHSTYAGITTLGQVTGTAATPAAPSTGTPTLQADDGVGLPTNGPLRLNGGVLQTKGTFSRQLSSAFPGNNVYWGFPTTQTAAGGGGFSAIDGPLMVNINGGSELGWGDTVGDEGLKILGPLKFGSVTSNAKTVFANPIDLNPLGTAAATRTVTVTAGTGGDSTEITGVIRNSTVDTALTKNGTGKLILSGTNTYTGATTVAAGSLLANNTSGSATGTGAVTVASGATLGGTGKVGGAVTNNGIIAPGSAGVGTLSVGGGVIDGANSSWSIELSGATADKLAVTGNVDLSALDSLNVTGAGTGSSWLIGTYTGALTGTFDTVTSGYTVSYASGNITLNAAAAGLPGDYNKNGVVDAADYVLWKNNIGQPAGTLPNDPAGGVIGAAQYTQWKANFGNHAGAGSGLTGGAVPEPTTIGLVLLGLVATLARRRR